MDTRAAVRQILKQLGLNGFEETTVTSPTTAAAVASLLKQDLSVGHKVARELKRQDLVVITRSGNHFSFRLTPAGAHRLQKIAIGDLKIDQSDQWDGKWRLVSFDVPLSFSHQRAQFAKRLNQLGFYMLQRSLWIIPYPCTEAVEALASHYNVWRYCTLIEANRLDAATTTKLKRHFFAS